MYLDTSAAATPITEALMRTDVRLALLKPLVPLAPGILSTWLFRVEANSASLTCYVPAACRDEAASLLEHRGAFRTGQPVRDFAVFQLAYELPLEQHQAQYVYREFLAGSPLDVLPQDISV
jgi:hypothetical protein